MKLVDICLGKSRDIEDQAEAKTRRSKATRFGEDRRLEEVDRMLQYSSPVTINGGDRSLFVPSTNFCAAILTVCWMIESSSHRRYSKAFSSRSRIERSRFRSDSPCILSVPSSPRPPRRSPSPRSISPPVSCPCHPSSLSQKKIEEKRPDR